MKCINWGILGTGKIANTFASEMNFVKNSRVLAVGSRTFKRSQEFADKHKIQKHYGSYNELLRDPDIDAVYIATPHSAHYSLSLQALKSTKHVLCEKPLAVNLSEAEKMIATAEKQNLLLMEAMWTAFLPHFQFVLDQTLTSELGNLISLTADFGFLANPEPESRLISKSLAGGSLLDIGIYPVFLALSLLGMPSSVEASAQFFNTGTDHTCNMKFHYPNGSIAKLKSTLIEQTPTEAELRYEFGTIRIKGRFHEPTSVEIETNNTRIEEFPTEGLGYSYEIDHFNNIIRKGLTESPIMNYETSLNLIATLDRVRRIIGLNYT